MKTCRAIVAAQHIKQPLAMPTFHVCVHIQVPTAPQMIQLPDHEFCKAADKGWRAWTPAKNTRRSPGWSFWLLAEFDLVQPWPLWGLRQQMEDWLAHSAFQIDKTKGIINILKHHVLWKFQHNESRCQHHSQPNVLWMCTTGRSCYKQIEPPRTEPWSGMCLTWWGILWC